MKEILKKESVVRASEALNKFDKNLKVEILEKTAKTAKEAAIALGCEVGAIVKSLLIKADDSFLLCLVSGDKKCSLKKLKKFTGKKDVCMANANDVKKITGYTIGGVSPIGHTTRLKVMIDKKLDRFSVIYAAAGHPNSIFKINYQSLVEITKGEVLEISE